VRLELRYGQPGISAERRTLNKEIKKCSQSVIYAEIVEIKTRTIPAWMSRMASGWRKWET
jgi:hypothetical protein